MSDDLRLRATVDDKASGPIRDIGRAVRQVAQSGSIAPLAREFSGLHGVLSTVGRELRSVTVPALGALGLVGGGVVASLVGVTKALAGLADKTLDLRFMSKELNFASNEIKAFGAAAEHFRIDKGQANSGLRNFARNVEDLRLNLGGVRDELLQHGGGDIVAAIRRSTTNMEALGAAVKRMQELSASGPKGEIAARRFAELMFGDAAFARMNAEEISKRLKLFGPQSKEEVRAAQQYADAINSIGHNFESMKNSVGAAVLPQISGAMRDLAAFFDARRESIAKGIGEAVSGIGKSLREIDWNAIGKGITAGAKGLELMAKAAGSIKDIWWIKALRWMFGGSEPKVPEMKDGETPAAKPSSFYGQAGGGLPLIRAAYTTGSSFGGMPYAASPSIAGSGGPSGMPRSGGSRPSVPQVGSAPSVGPYTPDFSAGGSAFLKAQRQQFAAEVANTPGLRERLGAMAMLEGAKDPVPVIEALANRYGYVNKERAQRGQQPLTIDQMLNGGFYGPINRGQLPGALANLQRNSKLSGKMNAALDAVLAGSNTIKGFTDQGLPSDPNGWRMPQFKRGGNVFPDWAGGPGGPNAAAAYREFLQRGVAAEEASGSIDRHIAGMGGASINGSASIKVDVNAPKGTKVGVGYGGIFKEMELTRHPQMDTGVERVEQGL